MKKLLLLVLVHGLAIAQVFNGTGGTIANSGNAESLFNLNISGLPLLSDTTHGIEKVCFDLLHPSVEELRICLRSPAGVEVELTGSRNCKGSDFAGTCFSNSEAKSVTIAGAPFTGAFSPVGNLGRFNRQLPGNGQWQLAIKDIVTGGGAGTLQAWSLTFGSSPARPVILNSSNLPIVRIKTPGGMKLTETDVMIDLSITDNGGARNYVGDAPNNYHGKAECHVRGSSSRMFEKKNLKLELKNSAGSEDTLAPLCSMPAESDWMLTACYTDKTMIRNPLSHEIFRRMGHYSPRCRFVEMILNEEYFGVYILMEQIKRGKNRLDIDKLSVADEAFPAVTGGYILQVDRTNEPGWFSLNPGVSANGAHFFCQYNYPRATDITPNQKVYIKSVLDSFETAVAAPSFANLQNGYRKFIDENSFIDYMILAELSKNVDAYKLSAYLHKDNILTGGKIHAGPPWDFDLAWHNADFGNAFDDTQWQFVHNNSSNPIPTWWRRFMEDSAFSNSLYCRYSALRSDLLSKANLSAIIDSMSTMLTESRERNYRQFPILGAYIWPNPQANQQQATYETEIDDLKGWIDRRSAWLDIEIKGWCAPLTSKASEDAADRVSVYPSVFSDRFNVVFSAGISGSVALNIYSYAGECVKTIHAVILPEMNPIAVDVGNLPPGLYFVKAVVNCQSGVRKVIKVSENW
jgi:hypothetical protein